MYFILLKISSTVFETQMQMMERPAKICILIFLKDKYVQLEVSGKDFHLSYDYQIIYRSLVLITVLNITVLFEVAFIISICTAS